MITFDLKRLTRRSYQSGARPPESIECPICSKPCRQLGPPRIIDEYQGIGGPVLTMDAAYTCRWRHVFRIRWIQVECPR